MRLGKLPIAGTMVSIYCNTSAGRSRPYVPMFQLPYGSKCSSPSMICRTQAPKQQQSWLHSVLYGQAFRMIAAPGHMHASPASTPKFPDTVTPLGDFTPPVARFLHVHIDLVGTLPTSAGYTYWLTAVDCFVHWLEVVPIPNITANTVARALLTVWIFRFGCPQTITTDQGHQFETQLFQSLVRLCGVQLSWTIAHHATTNGHAECFHRTLKAAIMCHADQQWT
jgi:cleavage and polyadenylation specificity factor subunit 1